MPPDPRAAVCIADRHRRDRYQARPRQLVMRDQVAAQRSAAHRQHRIVDGRARHQRTDLLELVDEEATRLVHAVRRDLRVEPGDRQPLRVEPGLAQRSQHDRRDLAHHAGERSRHHERLHHVVERRANQQRAHPGRGFREPRLRRFRVRRQCRRVVQQRRDLGAAIHVDRRVVDLGQYREAVGRQVEEGVQSLDKVQLPKRPGEVQWPGVDPRGLDAELPPVARVRQRDMANVVLEIEAIVLDPVGIVDLERNVQQLLPEDRRQVQPALDVLQQALEPHPAPGGRRGVIDVDQRDVGICVATLRIHEAGIFSTQLAHDLLSVGCSSQSAGV